MSDKKIFVRKTCPVVFVLFSYFHWLTHFQMSTDDEDKKERVLQFTHGFTLLSVWITCKIGQKIFTAEIVANTPTRRYGTWNYHTKRLVPQHNVCTKMYFIIAEILEIFENIINNITTVFFCTNP